MKEEVFQTLYSAHVRELYAYFFARCGLKAQTAEDLTQETFLAAYRARFIGLSSERTWLFGIARHKLNDYYRKACVEAADSLDDEAAVEKVDQRAGTEELADRVLENAAVTRCLDALPRHYCLVLTLKYAEGRSVRDIARLCGKSEKSIETTLARAKTAFAKHYLAEGSYEEESGRTLV